MESVDIAPFFPGGSYRLLLPLSCVCLYANTKKEEMESWAIFRRHRGPEKIYLFYISFLSLLLNICSHLVSHLKKRIQSTQFGSIWLRR
jgi:hypothetical protein